MVSGATLYYASSKAILSLTRVLTRHELLEDSNDVVATFLLRTAESLSIDRKSAAVLYLLSHGAVELFLVVMVLRERPWAYPLFMIALGLLIGYQTYQLSLGWSLWLIALTAFDLVILVLTWHEYRLYRTGHAQTEATAGSLVRAQKFRYRLGSTKVADFARLKP